MTTDIALALGLVEATNEVVSIDISKAPHILVAGMTGAGKSVLVHDLICQSIMRHQPTEVSLVLIDPKRVEFGIYKGLPHLALDPVYEDRDIEYALGWTVGEMRGRFSDMERRGVRGVDGETPWSRLIVVVDELANLMLRGKRFERLIVEIASMGRAAGVHLILATQRPDATVISGLIRANVPTRIALPTFTAADSRIILDMAGAEGLEVPDRLVRLPGQRQMQTVFGRHWTDEDIQRTLARWRAPYPHPHLGLQEHRVG